MDVTIYSKPNCPQCDATKRKFTKEGLSFEVSPGSWTGLFSFFFRGTFSWFLLYLH
ncbi:hypothetical protein CYJ25_08795 [Schaalia turicensis]|uniref:Glutaredoxin domain-containing protein n=1 Tax=Schaalia turicensis TaxID=131111 RepID=A0A2I1I3B2_9ACTO|nr:hypothetical protein CYJ25_08795 [Schaalia turicensis]